MDSNIENKEKPRVKTTKSIKFKLIISILPLISVMMIILTLATVLISQKIILSRCNNEMKATLETHVGTISDNLDTIKAHGGTNGSGGTSKERRRQPDMRQASKPMISKAGSSISGS